MTKEATPAPVAEQTTQAPETTEQAPEAKEQAPEATEQHTKVEYTPEEIQARLSAKDSILLDVYKEELKSSPKEIQKDFSSRDDALEVRLKDLRTANKRFSAAVERAQAQMLEKVNQKYPGLELGDLSKGPVVNLEEPPTLKGEPQNQQAPPDNDINRPLNEEEKAEIKSSPFGLLKFRLKK